MRQITRITLPLLLAVAWCGAASFKLEAKEVEYKQSDANFYPKAELLKTDPTAVIIEPGSYRQSGESYFITPKKKAPKVIFIQVTKDWVEPITPPNMPADLGVPPDAMQIREPQGDVEVAFPNALSTFVPAKDGLTIPDGSIVRTGANGTAAVLIGGVDSARLIPNSQASIQQNVTATLRTTKIDLTAGAVFSKVGHRIGEAQDYTVHTPFGVAAARGTDFVTVALPTRTDVWIAQGTVELTQPDGTLVGTVKSDGLGALKIIRFPVALTPDEALADSVQTVTMALDFIPMVDLKIKALREDMANGVKLTDREQEYLGRIKKLPFLIKLAMVEPPAPPVVAPAPAVATTPAPPPAPIDLDLRTDGKFDFQGATLTLTELKAKLADLAKTTPDQPIIVKPTEQSQQKLVKKIETLCHGAKFKSVTVDTSIADKAAADKAAAAKVAADKAAADKAAAKAAADKLAADKAAALKAAADKAAAEAKLPPIHLAVHADGKVDFQGSTLTLDELKPKLEDLAKATPGQPIVVEKKEKLEKGALRKVATLCKAAKLTSVTISKAPPPPAAVAAPTPATPTPAPAVSAPTAPLEVEARADGKVDFQGATLSLDDLKTKLDALAKTTPDQPIVVKKKEHLEKGQLRKVVEVVKAAKLTKLTVIRTEPPPAPVSTPAVLPMPAPIAPAPTVSPLPPAMELPLNLELRPDGKVNLESATLTLNQLKPKLKEIAQTSPNQAIVVVGRENVSKRQLKRVLALCHAAPLTNVTVAKAAASETASPPSFLANTSASLAPLPPASSPLPPSAIVANAGTGDPTPPAPDDALPTPAVPVGASEPSLPQQQPSAPTPAFPVMPGSRYTVP